MATHKVAFMETDHAIVRKIWKMLEEGIPPQYLDGINLVPTGMSQKSVTRAAELRTLGNASYNSGNVDEAALYYSSSVRIAPADTEELALAYANRSAVFLHRKLYEPCLLDVNRALAGPLSQDTRDRLLQRKTKAWIELHVQNNARKHMQIKLFLMKRIFREELALSAYERRLYYVSEVGVDDVDLVIDHSELEDPIWYTKFDGASPENVSPKIELQYDAQLGPHFVAKDDIDPGEPLYFEDVFSFVLLESMKLKYCNYCHLRCEALIPCTNCTVEMYCSTGCREEAYDSYHRVECQILPLWINIEDDVRELRVLCLRTFLRITKQGSELASLMNSSIVYKALDGTLNCANVQFSPENYPVLLANVVSRLTYSNDEEKIGYHIILRETIAIFASLRSQQFFGGADGTTQGSGYSSRELEYFGIALLVYQMSLTSSYFFHVEYCVVNIPAARGETESIGRGLSVLQCFTHHSCDPNIGTVTGKRQMLAYSLRPIKAGEQICLARRGIYTMFSREERRHMYDDFGFPSECTCKACVGNWPTVSDLVSRMDTYRTLLNEETYQAIQTMCEWLEEEEEEDGPDLFRKEDLERVIEFSKTIRDYVEEPSFTIFRCEYYIESVMCSKGNLFVEPK